MRDLTRLRRQITTLQERRESGTADFLIGLFKRIDLVRAGAEPDEQVAELLRRVREQLDSSRSADGAGGCDK